MEKHARTEKGEYCCSRSLARDLLLTTPTATFQEIYEYIKLRLWSEWRENNSHLSEEELERKKVGELSKLLTYDTNFVYNALDNAWSLRGELDEELAKE